MKKQRYNINNKTTKKQWLYLILELADLIIMPIVILGLGIDNDIFMAVSLGVIFIIAIVLCVLCVRDSRHNYNKTYSELVRKDDIITEYRRAMSNFNYDTATTEDKVKYLIHHLYVSSLNISCTYFYENTYMFTASEIQSLLRGKIGFGLDDFVTDILLKKIETKRIFKYSAILDNYIDAQLGLAPRDTLLYDDFVLYDDNYHFRAYIVPSPKSKGYTVKLEKFEVVEDGGTFWGGVPHGTSIYATYDIAYANMMREFNTLRPLYKPEVYEETPVDLGVLRYNILWKMWAKGSLRGDINHTCEYYSGVMSSGHLDFFQKHDKGLDEILDALSRTLPPALYDNVCKARDTYIAHLSEDNMELYHDFNKFANDNEPTLRGVLEEYANTYIAVNRQDS